MQRELFAFFAITVMFLYGYANRNLTVQDNSQTYQNNVSHIRKLIETFDENIHTGSDDKPKKQPFTAIQLNNRHVSLSSFFDLCQEICKEEMREVMTIITVKKCYDDGKITIGNDYMPDFISAVYRFVTNGNKNVHDVLKNPLFVAVHIVKKEDFEAYSENNLSMDAIKIMFKQLNALVHDHILETLGAIITKVITSFFKSSIASTVYKYDEIKNDKSQLNQDCDMEYFYTYFEKELIRDLSQDNLRIRIRVEVYEGEKANFFYGILYQKLVKCAMEMKEKAYICRHINYAEVFIKIFKSHVEFLLPLIADEINFGVKNILRKQNLTTNFGKYFETALATILTGTEHDFELFQDQNVEPGSIYEDMNRFYDTEQAQMIFESMISQFHIAGLVSDVIAKSELVTRVKQNNKFFTANSTKLILNKRLTIENLSDLCQTISNLKIFDRITENQIIYLNINIMGKKIVENFLSLLNIKGRLYMLDEQVESFCSMTEYEFSSTILDAAGQIVSICKETIGLKKGANLQTIAYEIREYETTCTTEFYKYEANNSNENIIADLSSLISQYIYKKNRQIKQIFKISKGNNNDITGSDIYILHHEKAGGQKDEKISVAYYADTYVDQLGNRSPTEACTQLKYYHNVPNSFLAQLDLQLQMSKISQVKIQTPNHFTFDGTDYFYKENLITLKIPFGINAFIKSLKKEYAGKFANFEHCIVSGEKNIKFRSQMFKKKDYYVQGCFTILSYEKVDFIVDKLILSQHLKHFFANNIYIYKEWLMRNNIYLFAIKLNEEKTILNIYMRKNGLYINQYFLDSSIEILLALLNDEKICYLLNQMKEFYVVRDFNIKMIREIIDEILFINSQNILHKEFVDYKSCSNEMLKLLKTLIMKRSIVKIVEENSQNLMLAESDGVKTLLELSIEKAFENLVKIMTTKILNSVEEISNTDEVILTSILIKRKQSSESNASSKKESIGESCEFEELEYHANIFVTSIENFEVLFPQP